MKINIAKKYNYNEFIHYDKSIGNYVHRDRSFQYLEDCQQYRFLMKMIDLRKQGKLSSELSSNMREYCEKLSEEENKYFKNIK